MTDEEAEGIVLRRWPRARCWFERMPTGKAAWYIGIPTDLPGMARSGQRLTGLHASPEAAWKRAARTALEEGRAA